MGGGFDRTALQHCPHRCVLWTPEVGVGGTDRHMVFVWRVLVSLTHTHTCDAGGFRPLRPLRWMPLRRHPDTQGRGLISIPYLTPRRKSELWQTPLCMPLDLQNGIGLALHERHERGSIGPQGLGRQLGLLLHEVSVPHVPRAEVVKLSQACLHCIDGRVLPR